MSACQDKSLPIIGLGTLSPFSGPEISLDMGQERGGALSFLLEWAPVARKKLAFFCLQLH